MTDHIALGGRRSMARSVASITCFALVVGLALSCWAGAFWLGGMLLRLVR